MSDRNKPDKKNVLWIFSDQHRGQAMSCSGCSNVETPNLDSLAGEGVRFTHTYSISPLCSPFRASVYTSQYIHQHGVGSLHRPIDKGILMLPEVFKANGYHTVHLGKWHLSGGAAPSHFVAPCFRPGWDTWIGWENSNRPFNTQYAEGNYPMPLKTLSGYQTDSLTDLAIDQLNSMEEESPWFMVVSIEPPHDPHVTTESYMRDYDDREISFRDNVPDCWKTSENITKSKGYYAQIKNLDDNIGRLIDTLKSNGQYDNTIIFYFSDHGDFMGSHNRVQKFYAEEESSNIPFIIRYPGEIISPSVSENLISSIDIPTTTLGLVGMDIPDSMKGNDYSEQIFGQNISGRQEVLIELNSWFDDDDLEYSYRALRTNDYLIIKARKDSNCRLYDMIRDPYQTKNLYWENECSSIRNDLETRLKRKLVDIGDDFYDHFIANSNDNIAVGIN